MAKKRSYSEITEDRPALSTYRMTMHDGSSVDIPMIRTKEGPAPDWRSQPECSRCGGHVDEYGDPQGGTLPVWRCVVMSHTGPDGKRHQSPQGNWQRYAAACSCLWGARIRHQMPQLERMNGRLMAWYDDSRMRLEGCSGSDLHALGIHLHGETQLEDAARAVRYQPTRERLTRAIDRLRIREQHGEP